MSSDKSDASQNDAPQAKTKSKSKHKSAIDLEPLLDKEVRIKCSGGRELVGVLKGYDQLTNLVLDNTVEMVRDTLDAYKLTDETRAIGLSVVRGTSVLTIASTDNEEEIANPFAQEVEEQNIG